MKKSKYQRALEWVAYNDDDAVMDLDQIEDFVTVALIADIFDEHKTFIAEEILKIREGFDS